MYDLKAKKYYHLNIYKKRITSSVLGAVFLYSLLDVLFSSPNVIINI